MADDLMKELDQVAVRDMLDACTEIESIAREMRSFILRARNSDGPPEHAIDWREVGGTSSFIERARNALFSIAVNADVFANRIKPQEGNA